jgi:uncharacterized protein YutE (UPF0331/DUF86 family)
LEQESNLIILAAESEDEVGTVLRSHLAAEQFLVDYLDQVRVGEIAKYVREPREFAGKLGLAAAFGLPLALVRILHQINGIRNKLAHRASSLDPSDVEELARQVDKLSELSPTFGTVRRRYIELPVKRPGQKIVFGSGEHRLDFMIAALASHGFMRLWLEARKGDTVRTDI